ncbi:MAG TPA: DoxX family protein [Bryobacteraceae bacterium]|jgi:putative oxidoreductase
MMTKKEAGRWALLALRLVVGFGFMAHGYAKLSRGPEGFATILQHLNVPMPATAAWLTIITEILGGLAVFLGAFVTWASIPMASVLIVATATVHFRYGFSSIRLLDATPSGATFGPVGYELDLLYFVAILTLALEGAGPFAIDNFRGKPREQAAEK